MLNVTRTSRTNESRDGTALFTCLWYPANSQHPVVTPSSKNIGSWYATPDPFTTLNIDRVLRIESQRLISIYLDVKAIFLPVLLSHSTGPSHPQSSISAVWASLGTETSHMPKYFQDVYARHLLSSRGYPLWTPEPSHNFIVGTSVSLFPKMVVSMSSSTYVYLRIIPSLAFPTISSLRN